MGEKLVAGFVTAAVIAPLCAACILGPAVFVSIFAGIVGWFGGLDTVATTGLVLVTGIVAYGLIRRRRAQRSPMPLSGELSDER
jgi:membrane protein implicated in regulation of membrane protease activity